MNTQSDQQLLQAYAASRSESAFAELVRRHINLVYSAALRRINDPHLAQDVTQGTFTALAKNARSLTGHPVLSGWLHRTTQNIAANLVRSNIRRQVREQEAVTMNELLSAAPDASWQTIAPHLDAALDGLDVADRDAVMLRYFEKKSASEMAVQLGISNDAAQKRVSRGVERLREFFAKRGVTVGAGGLAVVISANAVQAAPVGLALTISTVAALAGTTVTTTTTVTATKAIAMTALQKTIVTATIAVLAGAGIYEARQASQLGNQVQTLQQQQAPLTEESQRLKGELGDLSNQLAVLRDENERLNRNSGELLKLRGEVVRLKSSTRALNESNTADNYTQTFAKDLAERVTQFKQFAEQNPKEKIPEFEFLTDREWMNAAYGQLYVSGNFEAPVDYLRAMEMLRVTAETVFGNRVLHALNSYGAANDGHFPADFSQLQTYCDASVVELLLQLYEIKPASTLPENAFRNVDSKPDWVVTRKSPLNSNQPSRLATFMYGSARW